MYANPGKVSEALKKDVVKVPTAGNEDEFLLVAEKTEFREPTTFRDIMSSSKEAGRVVREAANHYKEIQVTSKINGNLLVE